MGRIYQVKKFLGAFIRTFCTNVHGNRQSSYATEWLDEWWNVWYYTMPHCPDFIRLETSDSHRFQWKYLALWNNKMLINQQRNKQVPMQPPENVSTFSNIPLTVCRYSMNVLWKQTVIRKMLIAAAKKLRNREVYVDVIGKNRGFKEIPNMNPVLFVSNALKQFPCA